MGRVVALRRQQPVFNPSEAFNRAWDTFPPEGRQRQSKRESWPAWLEAFQKISHDREVVLEACVSAYATACKSGIVDGRPGFGRWLKWGRWELWRPAAVLSTFSSIPAREFQDTTLRESFHLQFPSDQARRWLDRCTLDDGTIIAPPARAEWINGPFRAWAVANGLSGIKFR